MTSTTVRSFDVRLTVVGTVGAENAGDAVEALCELLRQGLGPDDENRKHQALIVHGEATVKSVFIPEGGRGQ